MQYATINGTRVPAMAVGTWAWGDKYTWDHKPEDMEGIKDAWRVSNELGLTFYDTAEVYGPFGGSEKIIGDLIKGSDKETRSKLYIASKYLPWPVPTHWDFFGPNLPKGLKGTLDRLGLETIDLYQIHMPKSPYSFKSLGQGLVACVKLGLARSVGVSNFSEASLREIGAEMEKEGVPIASNQIEYSLLRQMPDKDGLQAYMNEQNIACLAFSTLGQGRLTGKYSAENPMPSKRQFGVDHSWEDIRPLLDELKVLAEKYEVTMAAVAINWVIRKGAIPLAGARNGSQAEENAKAMTFELTEEEVKRLSEKGFDGKPKSSVWAA